MMDPIRNTHLSMNQLIGKCQSLMCFYDEVNNIIHIDPPNKQVKDCYKQFGVEIPRKLDGSEYMRSLLTSQT